MAGRAVVVRARVLEVDRGIETNERGVTASLHDSQSLHSRPNGTGLAAVRMDEHLGVGHALVDVVNLRFDGRQVVLRAALQNELAPERRHARNADNVLPNVFREYLGETCQQLVFAETFLLEVDAVGIEEDRAAVTELRRQLCFECVFGVFLDGKTELIGHRLKQHPVAGRALVRQLERLYVSVLHEEDFDVLTTDVTDHVDVTEIVRRAHHVRDGLDDVHVGANALLEHIGRVPRRPETHDIELGSLGTDTGAQVFEELFGVLNRIALRKRVRLHQDFAVFTEQDGLRRRAAPIETDHGLDGAAFGHLGLDELGDAIRVEEFFELAVAGDQRWAGSLAETLLAAFVDIAIEPV